ncbi:hypothetical protein [Aquabacterium sp. UBA2148]|uniref:hypothetical protein n=1 Tax=Aquabacterium sp. UBA2148 TaxID=1946042 RepID=UPI002580ACA4|nr:hypothetical protein [Aquabacterium sp. UBA2148]
MNKKPGKQPPSIGDIARIKSAHAKAQPLAPRPPEHVKRMESAANRALVKKKGG